VSERVQPLDFGVEWEPNAPDAVLISDAGNVVLGLKADPADDDERCVVLTWRGARFVSMSDPNDEAISGHRLHGAGLADVLWLGTVRESALIRGLADQNQVHPRHDPRGFEALTHYVLPLKKCVVEVVAARVFAQRLTGSTRQAAHHAFGGH
jgi:hypothetical protein